MKVTIKATWFEMIIPKGCRKARPQEFSTDITINIREVKSEKAPLAFLVDTYDRERREVLLYQGKLYRQFQDRVPNCETRKANEPLFENQTIENMRWDWWLKPRFSSPYSPTTFEDVKNDVLFSAKSFIIVNGKVYERCGVPYYYCFCTNFALLNNHQGGIFLFTAFAPIAVNEIAYGWSPIDKEKAIEGAKSFAINRDYSKHLDSIDCSDNIEVLIPTAIKGKFHFNNH